MKHLRYFMVLLGCWAWSLPTNASFTDFTKDKAFHQGYFSFYHDKNEGKIYLELTDFEQDFLFQSSMPHGIGSNDIGLDRGQLGDTRLVRFERVGNKVFLRQRNTYFRANSTNALEQQSVEEAFASSIIWGFKIAEEDKKNHKVLIDYTPFLLSDIHNVAERLKDSKQGNFSLDESRSGLYDKRSKAFPENTEFEAIVTYKGSGAGKFLQSVTPDDSAISVHLHHSLVKLPDDNYQPRQFHPYSGFWSVEYADYASALDEPLLKRVIPRHRLKKMTPDAELSEAVEPIIYYLDAGVPEPVRSALIAGALWWDQAFNAIGFNHAFQVKILPEDADPMDVRYNVIQWVHRATRGWSYGSSVIDPRTGEIIKGHVTLGSLRVRQDYLIALGLTSPFVSEHTDTSAMQAMALARIRQLAAHEVGHTLGIAHNFAASANDRASVMDYPHPLITIDNGKMDLSKAYAVNIGEWDKYVVAYGYGDYKQASEAATLTTLVANTQTKGLQYMSDPDARASFGGHATAHLWDNGSDAVAELKQVLQVRAKALGNIGEQSIPYGTPLSEIEEVLVPIFNFHQYQVEAVAKLIGGINYRYEVRDQHEAKGVEVVAGEQQQQAIEALLTTLAVDTLTIPEHIIKLIPPKAYGYARTRESFNAKTGLTFDPVSAAEANAKNSLGFLLNDARLARLQQQALTTKGVPSVGDLLTQLIDFTVKNTVSSGLGALVQQRINQQVVEHLLALWLNKNVVTEVRAEVLVSLLELNDWLEEHTGKRQRKSPFYAQYRLFKQMVDFGLAQGKQITPASIAPMPPGSPIG